MMGIYTIKNMVTNQLYIGSAVNFNQRFNKHKSVLKKNKHPNPKLQNSWNKYGEQSFRFQPEELVEDKNDLIPIEQQWLDVLWNDFDLFNLCPNANSVMLGRSHSDSVKEKMSLTRKGKNNNFFGKVHSKEFKQQLSKTRIGENNPFFGKKHTEETKRKIAENNRIRWNKSY